MRRETELLQGDDGDVARALGGDIVVQALEPAARGASVLGLAFAVVAIALADSLNPSLIIAAVYLALGPNPVRGTLAFSLSAFAVTLAGGVVVAVGLGDLILSLLPKLSRTLKYELMTALGVAVALGGAVIWWRRDSLAESEPPSRRPEADTGEGSAVLLGAGIAGVELLTAFPTSRRLRWSSARPCHSGARPSCSFSTT